MDHTSRSYHRSEDLFRHYPWYDPGDFVDFDEHHVHGWILSHVSLGARRAVRIQCRRIRQS